MESIFLVLLDMSLLSSYCIVIVLLIRLLLKKSPKVFSYLLWIAVFVRLSFPLMVESSISLVPQFIGSQSVVAWISDEDAQTAKYPPANSKDTIKASLFDADGVTIPILQTSADPAEPAVDAANVTLAQKDMYPSVPFVLSIVWVIGMGVLAVYNLGAYRHLKRQLKSALPVDRNVYESLSISSPFVLGFFRPAIYLPAGLEDSDRTYILRHEQIHIHRGDYAVKIILFAITCIHWFNPLVWLAFALMSLDMEMSCDERVIRDLGYDIRKNYSSSLLSLATGRRFLHATPLAFGEGNIKGRIRNILHYKKPTLWIILGSAVLVGCVVIGLVLNPLQSGNAGKAEVTEATEATEAISTGTSTDAAVGSTLESTVETTMNTTEETAAKSTTAAQTTSDPAQTTVTLDARYDNWFIDVEGTQISFRDVLMMNGVSNPFEYFSPADWKAKEPVDVSSFEAAFKDTGYSVKEVAGIANDSYVSGWMAESPDGKDTITCATYATEEDANLALCQFAIRWYYDYAKTNPTAAPLVTAITDSVLVIYDMGNMAGDDYFLVSYLSGKSVIQARIYVETGRLQNFFTSMVNMGIPFPCMSFNQQEITWPQEAVLGSSAAFIDYLTQRGYDAHEAVNVNDSFLGESDDLNFQVYYSPLSDKSYFDWYYLWGATGGYSTYFDYYSTDTYQIIVQGSSREYGVCILIDDVMINAGANNLGDLSEADAAKMREEVDTVISDLCFPK